MMVQVDQLRCTIIIWSDFMLICLHKTYHNQLIFPKVVSLQFSNNKLIILWLIFSMTFLGFDITIFCSYTFVIGVLGSFKFLRFLSLILYLKSTASLLFLRNPVSFSHTVTFSNYILFSYGNVSIICLSTVPVKNPLIVLCSLVSHFSFKASIVLFSLLIFGQLFSWYSQPISTCVPRWLH